MSIEERIGSRLNERGETVAVAESCTGGLVASLLTDVSGSSEYFDRSLVTYSNEAKQELLCVPREHLDSDGAVSESVARSMARGVRDTADTTWGVSTTGIAGPTGGTDEKPVGTVFVGVAHAAPWGTDKSWSAAKRYCFDGSRTANKRQFAERALDDLLDAIDSLD